MAYTVYLLKVRMASEKRAARLLIDSIRTFGGEMSGCPVWLFEGDPRGAPCRDLQSPSVRVIPLAVPEQLLRCPFGDKVAACARAPMVCILDVGRIGGMQVGEGGFTANIIDPLCPWNQDAWHFEGVDGELKVTRAAQADDEISIQGLSALVAGPHDPQDFPLRGWASPDPALTAITRALFPKLFPHLHEVF